MNLKMTEEEADLLRRDVIEYYDLNGTLVKFYPIKVTNEGNFGDDNHEYDVPIEFWAFFEQVPDIRMLKRIGWYRFGEALPMILNIPYYYITIDESGNEVLNKIKVEENTIVEFAIDNPFDTNIGRYKIKRITTDRLPALFWICNVVPIADRITQEDPGDTNQDGFSHLKVM